MKKSHWEVFQRVVNDGNYYSPRDKYSIFDVIDKHLNGLTCKHSVDGIKELYLRNG